MIAGLQAAHSFANVADDAGPLMPENQGKGIGDRTVRRRQIAVADPARRQPHGDFTVTRRLNLDLFHRDCLPECACNHRFGSSLHSATSRGRS